jgi:type VI secretion system secreted protein VgrG
MSDNTFEIKSESPVNDELMFWSITGHESLSRPSYYELVVLSKNEQIQPKDILGKAFDVVVSYKNEQNKSCQRHFPGHAVRMLRGRQVGRYYEYHISLRSWIWLLTRRTNSRIFQDKTVIEVMQEVMEDSPIKGIKKLITDDVRGSQKKRTYCVQHAETDFAFLNRLLEDEGIYYWFDTQDKAGTAYFSDNSTTAHLNLPSYDTMRFTRDASGRSQFNEITSWASANRLETGIYESSDYDYKTSKKKLSAVIDFARAHDLADFQMFESPGGYFNTEDAEAKLDVRSDELSSLTRRNWALTTWPEVAVGSQFSFEGGIKDIDKDKYLIAACTFVVSHPGYEGVNVVHSGRPVSGLLREAFDSDSVNAANRDAFEGIVDAVPSMNTGARGVCSFLMTVLSVSRPFRPARLTTRQLMPGPQSATVVGTEGQEIDVDEFGRVKVQFHWDRYGENNEKSTCWLRVAQPMAGKGWGGYFAPRIGQEVIVDFLNGDPDRPLVVSRVYNDDQPIPFKSPTESGFRTRSTPDGTAKQFNELRFDDKAGAEQVHIRAQKRMDVCVEQNYYEHIKGSSSSSVGGSQFVTVGHKQHLVVKNKQYIKVDDDAHWLYMGDVKFGIAQALSLAATKAIDLTGGTMLIAAQQKLELQCGASFIRLTPAGIEIQGPLVRINCGGAASPGMSPMVEEAKQAGGSKCLEGNPDQKKEKEQKKYKPPVLKPPKILKLPIPPVPVDPFVIPPFPQPFKLPEPAIELCVGLHEIMDFGDAAIDEIDALIEELDDATTELLDQAEGMSQEATQNFCNRVTNAQTAMHDAKKEIAKAQKAACDEISSTGAETQKLTQNVSNGVDRAMDRANAAVADPTLQDVMRRAGVGNDVNSVMRDANALSANAQNAVQKAQTDAVAGATGLVNQAGDAVDGAAQDVLNEVDPALDAAKEAAADAHRAVSKASDDAKKALQAAKAAAQAAMAAAKAAMAAADADVCLPIPGLAAMMAAARAEMQRLASMARALVQQGKDAASKAMDDAKKAAQDVEKTVDDAAKAAEEEAKEVLNAAEQRLQDLKQRVESGVDQAKQQADQILQTGQQTVQDAVDTITNQLTRAKDEATKILDSL